MNTVLSEYDAEVECVFAGALVCSGLCTGRPVPAQGYRIGRVEAMTGRCDARSPAPFSTVFQRFFGCFVGGLNA